MGRHLGGCLCGRIRFVVSGRPRFPHYCSCKACQRWSGAPAVAWVGFPRRNLRWTGPGGAPALFRSSAGCQRAFCPRCGSTLAALDDGAPGIDLTLGCFDDPAPFAPGDHSFPAAAPPWLPRLVPP